MTLARTQALSLSTKIITVAFSLIQAVVVARLLGRADYGVVGLVISIGSVIGVTQHLGIVDGTIREIAALRSRREAGKVFWVSHLIRQLVTVPLSLGLMVGAGVIATRIYDRPDLALYVQIFAASLILQGLQDVLGATLTGLRRFVELYVVQIGTAIVNVMVFAGLTWRYGVAGFFWAVIVTTGIMVLALFILVWRELRGDIRFPVWSDVRRYSRRVMRIGMYTYAARLFFVLWQRLPFLLLGVVLMDDQLGDLNLSLKFGSQLTIIAMALSEVNLSWMSSLFSRRPKEFKEIAQINMQRVVIVMSIFTLPLLCFMPEILRIFGDEFRAAHDVAIVVTMSFYLYALVDIATNSVFVAGNRPRLRTVLYGLLVLLTIIWLGALMSFNPHSFGAALGLFVAAGVVYAATIVIARRQFSVQLLPPRLAGLLLLTLLLGGFMLGEPAAWLRTFLFLVIGSYALWLLLKSVPERGSNALICFAGAFYKAHTWTNRQHVMSRLSQHFPVLYVEPRVLLWRFWSVSFLRRIVWPERNGNLWVAAQFNVIPGSRRYRIVALINHYLFNRWRIWLQARLLGFSQPDVWVYDTEAVEYLSVYKNSLVIYDCVDDHAAQAGANEVLVRNEEALLLSKADLVITTSRYLFDMMKDRHANVQLVLNAGDVKRFLRPVLNLSDIHPDGFPDGQKPVIGSVGTLDAYKYDFDLIYEVALLHEDWDFVFIGRPLVRVDFDGQGKTLRDIEELPNVYVIPSVRRVDIPTYVASFDVCIIPYRPNSYNRASFPLKFWEFMASGKPIVASGLPELEPYQDHIGIAEGSSMFTEQIEHSLRMGDVGREARIEMASTHSWDHRVAELKELYLQAISKR